MAQKQALAGWLAISTVLVALALIPSLLLVALPFAGVAGIGRVLLGVAALALAGPALSAGMYAARDFTQDGGSAPSSGTALSAFGRGYRMNFVDVLKVWLPAALAVGLLNYAGSALNATGLLRLALGVLTGLVLVWGLQALTIATFISMRAGGVARLALLYLFRLGKVVLGVIAAVVVAAIVIGLPFGLYILAALAAVFMYLLYQNARPMLDDATEHYTV
jgi:hypothetical protein